MVAHLGSWAARALSLLLSPRADAAFALKAATATDVLQQQWYNTTTGLWDSTGWWNAANALTVLGDYAYRGGATGDHRADIVATMANTFVQAQQVSNAVSKTVDAGGLVHSFYLDLPAVDRRRGFHGFINDYYDDEGWWALAWIRAYDVTRHAPYLDMAISIVDDMAGGGGTPSNNTSCGGGIWWSKSQTYKNAIANELYLAALALLANRAPTPQQKQDYAARAVDQWQWFRASGMINNASLINDGLSIASDGTCTNNGGAVWSYNQGVVLGGLVELFVATGDASLLVSALAIAHAAIAHLAVDGILHEESCDRDGNSSCGGDGATFKGVFLRNLGYLCEVELIDADTRGALKDFIRQNANSIWDHDRNAAGQFGLSWSGPVADAGAGAQAPTAATHASAMDCLVAAASFL